MRTEVREISHKGSSSVVEWTDDQGNLKRSILPSDQIVKEKGGSQYVDDVEDGYLYGVDWERLIHTKTGPKGIADLLRRNGIWTLEDYARNTAVVTSVFNQACSENLQNFREAVIRHGRNEE